MEKKLNYLAAGALGIFTGLLPMASYSSTSKQQVFNQENLYKTNFKTYAPSVSKKVMTVDAYFQQWAEEQGFQSDQFRLQYVKESLTAKHYHYQQYERGLAVYGATITISVSTQDASLIKSHSHIIKTKVAGHDKADFKIDQQQALELAWNNIRASGRLRSEPTVEKVWLPTEDGLLPTYRIIVAISNPLGDWEQFVDAQSGKVIKLDQKAIMEKSHSSEHHYSPDHFLHIDIATTRPLKAALNEYQQKQIKTSKTLILTRGTGTIFDPDPKTTLDSDDLTDDSAAAEFEDAYFNYTLPEVTVEDGVYYLKSPWVEIDDFDSPSAAPATSTDGNWQFVRGQNGFDDTNVFYHLDASQRYIQSLGFSGDTGIQFGVIRADANGADGADNSYFSPSANTLSFGHGGVNDSEDADVILHEYGHAINYSINASWGGPDAGGMGEGFGDYWAGSYSLSTLNGDSFFPNRVFTWDGHNEFWAGRILNDLSARYNPDRSYPAHSTVDGVLSDQLWSTPLFQSLLQLLDMGYAREDVDTIILEAQFGLGGGLTMTIMAESIVQTANRLFPGKPHAGVFYQNFASHNIIEGGLNIGAPTLSAGDDDIILPGEVVSVTVPLTGKGVAATDIIGKVAIPADFNPVALSSAYADIQSGETVDNNTAFMFEVPSDTACGAVFDLNFTYSSSINDFVFSGEKDFEFVIGRVASDRFVQNIPLSIPDNGAEVSSTLTIDQPGSVVNDLRVKVDVEHTYIGDLTVGIESPAGTRVILHSRSGGGQDNLQVTYPDDATPAQSLSLLDGESLSGQWTLFVQDNASWDVGQVVQWEMIFEKPAVCE